MVRRITTVFALLIFISMWFASCKKNDPTTIPEDQMIQIMADLNLSDQIIKMYPAIYRDSIRNVLTQRLLKVHNISQVKLDTNLYLYQSDLDRYKIVSEKVVKYLESLTD